MKQPTFKCGERVTRLADVFNPKSKLLKGNIIAVYSRPDYPELYDVKWSDGEIARAFLPHGLNRAEPENIVDFHLN